MTLYYISLGLDYDEYISQENELRYDFQLRTRFISNYLSKNIRKIKFKTDNTFNMLSISLSESKPISKSLVYSNVLDITLPFNRDKYFEAKENSNFEFYLNYFTEGFKIASEFKKIPLENLMQLIDEFRNNEYKNEWISLKKRFKIEDLEIVLKSEFTTDFYQVILKITQISTKKILIEDVIIKTDPDEIAFDYLIKSVEIQDNILIKNKFEKTIIEISKKEALKGKLEIISGNY